MPGIYDRVSDSVPDQSRSKEAIRDEGFEILCRPRVDATINGSVHAQEGDDVLKIALDLGSHLGVLDLLYQGLNILWIVEHCCSFRMYMTYCFREGYAGSISGPLGA